MTYGDPFSGTPIGDLLGRSINAGDVDRHYKAGLLTFSGGHWVVAYPRDIVFLELGFRVEQYIAKGGE